VIANDSNLAADRFATATLAIAVVLAAWQTITPWGWMGSLAANLDDPLYWVLILVWGTCLVCVLRRRRHYWVLLTAPIVLAPATLGLLVIVGCMQGDCL
jgi:hypothetical protein